MYVALLKTIICIVNKYLLHMFEVGRSTMVYSTLNSVKKHFFVGAPYVGHEVASTIFGGNFDGKM